MPQIYVCIIYVRLLYILHVIALTILYVCEWLCDLHSLAPERHQQFTIRVAC